MLWNAVVGYTYVERYGKDSQEEELQGWTQALRLPRASGSGQTCIIPWKRDPNWNIAIARGFLRPSETIRNVSSS